MRNLKQKTPFLRSTIIFILIAIAFTIGKAQIKPEITVQTGHTENIYSVDISADGKYVLSGSSDKSVKLWDIATGKVIRTFSGHTSGVSSVAISPDGNYGISGSLDYTIRLWNLHNGKQERIFKGHTDQVKSVAFSPDGKFIISGSDDKTIKLWDINNDIEVKTFSGGDEYVNAVVFSANGKTILSGFNDGTVKLWGVSSGQILTTYSTDSYSSKINSVAFSPDGKFVLASNSSNLLKWDKYSGQLISNTDAGDKARLSKDGNYALLGNSGIFKVWDAVNSIMIKECKVWRWDFIVSMDITADGKYIVYGTDRNIKLYKMPEGTLVREFSGDYTNMVFSASLSPDLKGILTCTGDNTLKLWDISNCSLKTIGKDLEFTAFTPVQYSSSGKYAITGGKKPLVWNLLSGKEPIALEGHNSEVNCIAFSSDEKYVFTGSDDNTAKVWEASTGKEIKTLSGHSQAITAIAISPDGKKLATASSIESKVHVWNIGNGTIEQSFTGDYLFGPKSLAYSPDGKFLLVACFFDIRLLNISSGEEINRFKGHTDYVNSVAFSPDGKFALSGSNDNLVKLWDISTGKEIKSLSGHSGKVSSVSFSKDGTYALSSSWDNSIRFWNLKTSDWTTFMADRNNSSWLVFNSDGYWDASQNGGSFVAMVQEINCWNIDQFAVQNNRPDKILEKLPNFNPLQKEHYYAQYKKRLKKLGINETQLQDEFHVPEAKIISTTRNDKFLDLKFSFNDTKYKISHYNIYVNDVPIFGSYGKESPANNTELTETIELTPGRNKIEVSCMNENGMESFRALTYEQFDTKVKRNLYVLTFGVSKYQNQSYNLQYADKDAKDLANTFESLKGKAFENVYTKTLTNDQVTLEAIKASKDFVKDAKPDDYFVLFIAGHGMHDADATATYYYLTYNADINNLENTAANFETIESLLQGIPPRNKLFLMDACESGELDTEEQDQFLAAAKSSGMVSRGFKKAVATNTQNSSTPKRSFLHQKDRFIYNDLFRRSGAIVFSSSKGGELSYERSDIKNGLFTKYIMQALTTAEADVNESNFVSIDELREYVSTKVAEDSGDLQHPTVDRDNIYQKFGFSLK